MKLRQLIGVGIHSILSLVSIILILLSLLIIYGRIFLKYETIQIGKYSLYVVASGSMEPGIQIGDLVLVQNDSNTEYQVGDIITFLDEEGSIVTHRIKIITDKGFITKGDANIANDSPISVETVRGKVIKIFPSKTKIMLFLSKWGSGLFLSFILIYFCWKQYKK